MVPLPRFRKTHEMYSTVEAPSCAETSYVKHTTNMTKGGKNCVRPFNYQNLAIKLANAILPAFAFQYIILPISTRPHLYCCEPFFERWSVLSFLLHTNLLTLLLAEISVLLSASVGTRPRVSLRHVQQLAVRNISADSETHVCASAGSRGATSAPAQTHSRRRALRVDHRRETTVVTRERGRSGQVGFRVLQA